MQAAAVSVVRLAALSAKAALHQPCQALHVIAVSGVSVLIST